MPPQLKIYEPPTEDRATELSETLTGYAVVLACLSMPVIVAAALLAVVEIVLR